MTNLKTLIHNFAFEVQEGLSDDQIGDKSVELLNEILDLVEKGGDGDKFRQIGGHLYDKTGKDVCCTEKPKQIITKVLQDLIEVADKGEIEDLRREVFRYAMLKDIILG